MTIQKLNILLSYPVKWSIDKVLRDFIQNFFDATGPEKFYQDFKYHYEDKTLKLFSKKDFSIEWLMYLGTSTKRTGDQFFAGNFGEGFKIASLIAKRDFNLKISMESQNWCIEVCKTSDILDNKKVEFLAYNIYTRQKSNETILTIENLEEENYKKFLKLIEDFYYFENPILGEPIIRNRIAAVYKTAPAYFKQGCLFVNYQKRATFNMPLVFCHNNFHFDKDDRDREDLSSHDIYEVLENILYKISDEAIQTILESIPDYWQYYRHIKGVNFDYMKFIRKIARILAFNPKRKQYFKEKYSEMYITDFCGNTRFEKCVARAWYRNSDLYGKRKIVHPILGLIGIPDIYYACQEDNGFEIFRNPTDKEKQYIKILQDICIDYFNDIILCNKLPSTKIITNPKAPLLGSVYKKNAVIQEKNIYGLLRKFNPIYIRLKQNLLTSSEFETALTTYLHEMLHAYGSDNSNLFRKALLLMNSRILEILPELEKKEILWRKLA